MGRIDQAFSADGILGALVSAVALALLALAPAAAQEAQDPVFRSDVRLVRILATVKDATGAPIGGLSKEDFRIIDGDAEREIAVFERHTNRPLSVALLVDASLSTAIDMAFEKRSARRFLSNLLADGSNPDDRAAVLAFSEGVEMLSNFTHQKRRLHRAVDRIEPDTGTSMYDAVMLASEELSHRRGRRVLVVITDGGDTTSYSNFRQALEAAHEADAVIYGVTVVPIKSDAGRNTGGENALNMMARGTGGTSFIEYGEEALDRAFSEILSNLRTQYLLAYYPPKHEDSRVRFRRIEVSVSRPGATVLARNGYYVPEERKILPESISPTRVNIGPNRRPPPAETSNQGKREDE